MGPSYKAVLKAGIIGLGYGITAPNIISIYKKENQFCEIKRKKGNSILANIEESCIDGLILFLFLLGFSL